jgi:cellulose synthase/poly-beta-1,6-N-acetylglucosamine synthase-like glycosyltransferase
MVDTLFTLSGACAVYRRAVLDQFGGYRGRTVSEDTDMTLMLHQIADSHVGYLSNMRVHLAPVLSWAALYSQRTRWQRGALEVTAVHTTHRSQRHSKRIFWRIALPMRLQVDHTLALPRLAWTLMIFMMPLFGYSWGIIGLALALLMVFYVVVNMVRVLTSYLFSMPPEKVLIREYLSYIPFLPLYNTFLFWVRMSALTRTLTEDATWTVQNPLLQNLENGNLQRSLAHMATNFFSLFS